MGSSSRALPTRQRGMFLGAALLAAAAALLAGPARSQAETCSDGATADICVPFPSQHTNSEGVYTLYIPARYIGSQPYLYPELQGCVWKVKADFGDGSPPWEGEFDTEKGIEESHPYSSYGVYHAVVDATEGKKPNAAPCKSVHIMIPVTYSEPTPEKPPSEPPPSEEPTGGGGGPTGSSGGGGGSDETRHREPGAALIVFWSACGRGIYVHRVACGKARTVVGKAKRRFTRDLRSVRVLGFACRFRPKALHRTACRRGGRRILAP